MNLKTGLALISIGFLAAFGTGCGNACDDLVDHYEECGFEVGDGGDSDAECTDEAEKLAECLNDKSCDALKDGSAFTDCAGG